MYMLIGEQQGEAGEPAERRARFEHMAQVVRQSPGFVRGSWGADEDDPAIEHALVVLDTLENAQALRRAVETNVTGVRLRLMAVAVEAGAS
ncbi:hypothetical protein AB0C04_02360 [Micromonospora sp. NPDC048909]|uniref:hypothetical protein n=1 Tax=Micromonospora sp. NPDC048909 TaxID=3155643 RepID=UPI0033C1A40C